MEHITLETPLSKIPIVLKPFITGGDAIELEAAAMGSVSGVNGKSGEMQLNAEQAYRARLRKLVDIIVVSCNGKTDKEETWKELLNMPARDYDFVMQRVSQISEGLSLEVQKK